MPTLLTNSTSSHIVPTSTNGTYTSTDSSTYATNSSSQHHTNLSGINKISNLVVDSTCHSAPSSPTTCIESTTMNSNNNTQLLSPNDHVRKISIIYL